MKTLTQKVYHLAPPGGVFDITTLTNLFPDRSAGARRLLLDRAVQAGEVLRLRRGLYVLAPEYRRSELHPFALAGMIYSPSHISLESALAYWNLIPEMVYQVASVGLMKSRSFDTPLGVFFFQRVPTKFPKAGVEARKLDQNSWAFVASPLRAIADMVYLNRSVSWKQDGLEYLSESLRMEAEDLSDLSFERSEEIINAFRSRRVKDYLLNLRRRLMA